MATKKVHIDILAKDKTRAALRGAQKGINNLKNSVFSLKSALIGIGVGATVKSFITVGSEIEKLQVRLKFLFGSAEEGAKAFDKMAKFAGKVPFSLEQIQQGAGVLAVVSDDAEELSDIMKITGNVAAVTGLDFKTTAEQIQMSLSAGISAADLFREKGVKDMLGFKAGATVSIEETVKAFERVFGPGGKFDGATDELAKTFEGTLSMIGDSVFNFKRTVAEAGLFDFVKFTAETVDRAIKSNFGSIEVFAERTSNTLIDAFENIALGFVHLGSIFQTPLKIMFDGVKNLLNFMGSIPEPFRSFGIIGFLALGFKGRAAVILVGAFFEKIYGLVEGLAKLVGEELEKIDADFKSSFDNMQKEAKDLASVFSTSMGELGDFMDIEADFAFFEDAKGVKLIKKFFSQYRLQVNASTQTLGGFINEINKSNDGLTTTGEKLSEIDKALNGFKSGWKKAMESASDMTKQFEKVGLKAFTSLQQHLTDFVMTGKMNFKSLKEVIIRSIVEALIGKAITSAIQKSTALIKMDSIRKAMIYVYEAALNAFRSAPFPLNLLLVGGTLASGMALVNKIKGFEKGGRPPMNQPSLVGEKGPELFVPDTAGRIIPNNQLGSEKPVNVNFNITTVDASGFNQLLNNSRGTIVNMINSAVNETGRQAIV